MAPWAEGTAPRASSVGVCSDLRSALRVQLKLVLEVDSRISDGQVLHNARYCPMSHPLLPYVTPVIALCPPVIALCHPFTAPSDRLRGPLTS
jgi:hypothetical protein